MKTEKEWLQYHKAFTCISFYYINSSKKYYFRDKSPNKMEMEHITEKKIKNGMHHRKKKEKETTQLHRKGLILYLILFSTYLLILILWKDMAQWHGNGTHH